MGRARKIPSPGPRFELRVDEENARTSAVDLWVRCANGDVYTLWAATPEGIARAAGDAAPYFYCPNLLAVRELDKRLLREAVKSLWRNLPLLAVSP